MDFELPFGLTPLSGSLPQDHRRYYILPGPMGTSQTIQRMRKVVSSTLESMRKGVTKGKRVFEIRRIIGEIIAPCATKDYYCYAKALYEYCRDRIKYTFDPVGVELVESPERILLESRIADCDSIVTVLATLYEAIGFPARFVTVRADPMRPDDYSHVFLEVNLPRHGWVAADPTMPDKQFGWAPDPKFPRKNWPASLDPESDVRDDVLEAPKPIGGLGMYNIKSDDLVGHLDMQAQQYPVVTTPGPTYTRMNEPSFIERLAWSRHFTRPIVAPPKPWGGLYGIQSRRATAMNDYLNLTQVRYARPLMGLGAMTADQSVKAAAMLQVLKNYQSRLRAWKGIGYDPGLVLSNLEAEVLVMQSAISAGNWDAVQTIYKVNVASAEKALAEAQATKSYGDMTATQTLAVGPYANKGGIAYALTKNSVSGETDWAKIGLIAGAALLLVFLVKE
jgi:hypothetical protein